MNFKQIALFATVVSCTLSQASQISDDAFNRLRMRHQQEIFELISQQSHETVEGHAREQQRQQHLNQISQLTQRQQQEAFHLEQQLRSPAVLHNTPNQ